MVEGKWVTKGPMGLHVYKAPKYGRWEGTERSRILKTLPVASWCGTGSGGPDEIEEISGDGIRQSLDVRCGRCRQESFG